MSAIELFDKYHIIWFPYFLGVLGFATAFIFRSNEIVKQHAVQVISLVILLPVALFAVNKGWHQVMTLISGLIGYIFGSQHAKNAPTRSKSA